jgi:hypothetical protein
LPKKLGILLVQKLSTGNIPLLIGLSLIGFDVRYMYFPESTKKFNGPSGDAEEQAIRQFSKWGLTKINFNSVAGLNQYGSLKSCPEFAQLIYNKHFKNTDFNALSSLFEGLSDCQKKLPILAYDILINNIIEIGDLLSIAKAYNKQGLTVRIFHPVNIILGQVFKSNVSGFKNIYPSWLGIGNEFFSVILKLVKTILGSLFIKGKVSTPINLLRSDNNSSFYKNPPEVVFFPHQGVIYGENIFLKDYFYDDDPESPLNSSRILHIELHQPPPEISVKYYADNNISHTVISGALAINRHLATLIFKAFGLLWSTSQNGNNVVTSFVSFVILFKSYLTFVSNFKCSVDLQGSKLALVGYDYLFPTGLALALQARGIKLAAVQERFVHVFNHKFHPIFDLYFISGSGVRKQLEKNPFYCIGGTPIVGLVRAELLKEWRHHNVPSADRVVLVLDFHSNPDRFMDVFDPLFSWESNRDFYLDILQLAEKNLNIKFVIRGKDDAWCSLPYFDAIRSKIDVMPNVTINRQYDEIGVTYKLAASADLVIARQTSLADESLAAGIPVLIHDWRECQPHNVSVICDYRGYDVYVHDFETLAARVNAFFQDGVYLPDNVFDEMRSELYSEETSETKKRIMQCLKLVLEN